MLTKIVENFKECGSLYVGKIADKYIFPSHRKSLIKYNGETFNEGYSLRFTNSARFMEASIETLVNNLQEIIHNRKCKHCMECKQTT